MNIKRLVKMANDIADFFDSEEDKEIASEGVKNHLQVSWDPRMKKQIIRHFQENGEGLSPLASQAIKKLGR
jgi:formate dehydrogenase subunit delta